MMKKMSWEEMKKTFPDEWLLIVQYELDNSGHLIAGIVDRHSKEKDEVPGSFNWVTMRKLVPAKLVI